MATKKKQPGSFRQVRVAVSRVGREGAHMVGRLRHDARALVARSRAEALRDVRTVRQELRQRADRAVRELERKVVHEFHAATEAQVRRLERRVVKLEQQVARMAPKPSGKAANDQAA